MYKKSVTLRLSSKSEKSFVKLSKLAGRFAGRKETGRGRYQTGHKGGVARDEGRVAREDRGGGQHVRQAGRDFCCRARRHH